MGNFSIWRRFKENSLKFPKKNWQIYIVPNSYWENLENQAKIWVKAENRLNIKEPQDWYKIKPEGKFFLAGKLQFFLEFFLKKVLDG